jgi:hypothetical protein
MTRFDSVTLARSVTTTALLVATMLLAGCAGAPASAGGTGTTYPRCGPQSYVNADCYGGPPI